VKNGLTWWINNGMVEGHVTKLKLIKRQGYGKAGFPLLAPGGCCMHCSVFTSPLHLMLTRDWMDHIFLVRQPTHLLQYGRGSIQGYSQQSSFHLITASLSRREWRDAHGDLLLVQQNYPGDPRHYWGLPGGQVETGEELLAGLQRKLLEKTGLNFVGTPIMAFVLQVLRETEEGIQEWLACHFACGVAGQISPHDPDGLVLSAHWVEEQHREPCIQSRLNKAGVHFGEVVFAFSPQRKQASSKPPKWP